MLALNLNLAASGLLSGSWKVLSQTLERVLDVVEFPAGAILLRHGSRRGNTLAVTRGSTTFR